MGNLTDPNFFSFSFVDFPEDVQLCILSFLTPSEVTCFACTSKRFVSLCKSDSKLWFTMCDRRWGSKTEIKKWGKGKISYKQLYRTLSEWENLIGFWRRSGQANFGNGVQSPPLIFFEWGSSFVAGYRVSPSNDGSDRVVKSPFLWMGLNSEGEVVCFLVPEGKSEFGDLGQSGFCDVDGDSVPVNLSFMGKAHFVVEENMSFGNGNSQEFGKKNGLRRSSSSTSMLGDDYQEFTGSVSGSPGSLPDRMSEIYQYFANRTSPGADRALRRQRRREKERQGRKKWEPEHFVKVIHCSPTPSRPLQGLWKGVGDEMNLDFYLVAYDDIGGITCRRVGESAERLSGYAPVFWTSNATFIEAPFSADEEDLYSSRIHLLPVAAPDEDLGQAFLAENELVSRILHIRSSYDLVIPDIAEATTNPRHVEGRIWQYCNGTFGFGFLRDNFIIDLKSIALNGCLLDIIEPQSD